MNEVNPNLPLSATDLESHQIYFQLPISNLFWLSPIS